jgi:hypothetical protein
MKWWISRWAFFGLFLLDGFKAEEMDFYEEYSSQAIYSTDFQLEETDRPVEYRTSSTQAFIESTTLIDFFTTLVLPVRHFTIELMLALDWSSSNRTHYFSYDDSQYR